MMKKTALNNFPDVGVAQFCFNDVIRIIEPLIRVVNQISLPVSDLHLLSNA